MHDTMITDNNSEQMLLSIEAQLCTCRECKTFRTRRPSSVAMHKVFVRRIRGRNILHSLRVYSCASMLSTCASMLNICSETMSAARMSLYSITGNKFLTKQQTSSLPCRIQQLQLVVSGVRGPELEKLWRQITTEISLQKNKSLLLAYHTRDKTVTDRLLQSHQDHLKLRQKVLEYSHLKDESAKVIQRRAVRVATVEKKESESLGMSITVSLLVHHHKSACPSP